MAKTFPVTIEQTFTPEAPYDCYKTAELVFNHRRNRRFVVFYGQGNARYGIIIPRRTTYGRYLYQVKFWKEHKIMIPDGYEVDHINNISTDDRIENLQLLTGLENTKKRDTARYSNIPVTKEMIEDLKAYLSYGYSWDTIAEKLSITHGHVRYLLSQYISGYNFEHDAAQNIDAIKNYLDKGVTLQNIGYIYGVAEVTIQRIVKRYLPDYKTPRECLRLKKLEQIREMLLSGITNFREIARKVGYTDSNVCIIAHQHFPELMEKIRGDENKKREEQIRAVGDYLARGVTHRIIAKELNITPHQVWFIANKYYPEYNKEDAIAEKRRKILEAFDADPENVTATSIAKVAGCGSAFVYRVLKAERPQYFDIQARKKEERLALIKQCLDEGLSVSEAAERCGVAPATIYEQACKYFPDRKFAGSKARKNT